MAERKLTPRQEKFAQAVVLNGGDKVKAREEAGYSMAMSKPAQAVDADNLFNHPKISLRIAELQKKADKVAEAKFEISVEQRLRWLKDATEKGLGTYVTHSNFGTTERVESIGGAVSAINTMNAMLGVDEKGGKTKPVKVMIGVADAS